VDEDDPIKAAIHATPIRDALAKLEKTTDTGAEIGAVASDSGGIGVVGRITTGLPKDGTLSAQGQWTTKSGWSVAAVARWVKGK
jgi:hypothetical protein